MNNSKIEWCDMTWNPVTGCLHSCEYCYARGIARRFSGCYDPVSDQNIKQNENGIISLEHVGRTFYKTKKGKIMPAPYPFGFAPTFHRYRLDEPQRVKKQQNIFVCSMADLFGEWVPDIWIEAVFEACAAAPWHRYLFLTKNPRRYCELAQSGLLPDGKNFWWGTTATTADSPFWSSEGHNTFLSIEPILGGFPMKALTGQDWIIVGAMTGPKKRRYPAMRDWIMALGCNCRSLQIPLFMKNSLADICRGPLIQEFPWPS